MIFHGNNRTPQPGDVVIIDRDYTGVKPGALAVIDGGDHYGRDNVMAVVGASAFRDDHRVSCSGGPCPCIPRTDLVKVGSIDQLFWRWHKGQSGAGNGEQYSMSVTLWTWKGES